MLVATMNPCPFGYFGDLKSAFRCGPVQVQCYRDLFDAVLGVVIFAARRNIRRRVKLVELRGPYIDAPSQSERMPLTNI